jgi:large subunit ribosomal protein L4
MTFDTRKVLLVLGSIDKNIILSSRNLQDFKVTQATDLNTFDILNCTQLILSEKSIPVIETVLSAQ